MKTCPSCGGIIGRDCFNPIECAWISESMAVDDAVRKHEQKQYDTYLKQQEKEYYDWLETEMQDMRTAEDMKYNGMMNRFLKVA